MPIKIPLDSSALTNLGAKGMPAYEAYKERLFSEGHSLDDIDTILRGYIWECLEQDSTDEEG